MYGDNILLYDRTVGKTLCKEVVVDFTGFKPEDLIPLHLIDAVNYGAITWRQFKERIRRQPDVDTVRYCLKHFYGSYPNKDVVCFRQNVLNYIKTVMNFDTVEDEFKYILSWNIFYLPAGGGVVKLVNWDTVVVEEVSL